MDMRYQWKGTRVIRDVVVKSWEKNIFFSPLIGLL